MCVTYASAEKCLKDVSPFEKDSTLCTWIDQSQHDDMNLSYCTYHPPNLGVKVSAYSIALFIVNIFYYLGIADTSFGGHCCRSSISALELSY